MHGWRGGAGRSEGSGVFGECVGLGAQSPDSPWPRDALSEPQDREPGPFSRSRSLKLARFSGLPGISFYTVFAPPHLPRRFEPFAALAKASRRRRRVGAEPRKR